MDKLVYRGGGSGSEFAERLEELKQQGCNVLVGGTLTEAIQQRICQRAMGESDLDRCRILVLVGTTTNPGEWFPDGLSPESDTVHFINVGDTNRSATSTEASTTQSPPIETPNELSAEIETQLASKLSEIETDPDELRVVIGPGSENFSCDPDCIDSIVDTMNKVDGTSYLFLPREDTGRIEANLCNDVHILVDVRTPNVGAPVYQWTLVESGIESHWMPIRL